MVVVVLVVPSLSESFTVAKRVRTTPTLTRWNSQECFIGPKNYTYYLSKIEELTLQTALGLPQHEHVLTLLIVN